MSDDSARRPSFAAWTAFVERRGVLLVLGVALVARLGVVLWAAERFPPADDGIFYQIVAERIARGLGYTWLWPDGAVTYAAHYPVGYPGLLGALYAVFGSAPVVAMLFHALLGSAAALAVHRLALAGGGQGVALAAGLVAALHPSLLFYTPALMTEGVSAALLAILGALALRVRRAQTAQARRAGLVALGLIGGVLFLVRPQTLLILPLFGALAVPAGALRRALAAGVVTAVAFAVCVPWTVRNCVRMERCVLVSANVGWNLFIGAAPGATGIWVPLEKLGVPEECRSVFAEAEKDVCFGKAGMRHLLAEPGRYLALIPKKLAATFDWSGAPGYYLHTSNPFAFDDGDKLRLGVAEAVVERLLLLLALVAVARIEGPRRRWRVALAVVGGVVLLSPSAWVTHVALVVAAALLGRELWERPAALLAATVIGATACAHAVFFGAGRYGLVVMPFVIALGVGAFRRSGGELRGPPLLPAPRSPRAE